MLKKANIAIVGQPNAGKSTLLNTILNKKISIVTYKPQTTRNFIKHIYKNKNYEFLFIDTPGFLKPKHRLDLFLLSQIKQSLRTVSIVLFLVDSLKGFNDIDNDILHLLNTYNVEDIFLLLTKHDLFNGEINIENYQKHHSIKKIFAINCNSRTDVNNLLENIYNYLPDGINVIEGGNTEDDNFIISEIIREQALIALKHEVPHCLAVKIEDKNFNKENNLFTINASVVIEKESQKKIVIGQNGSMIKNIGIKSRHELLKIFDCKINLKLFVVVKKNWRDNVKMLSELGYYNK